MPILRPSPQLAEWERWWWRWEGRRPKSVFLRSPPCGSDDAGRPKIENRWGRALVIHWACPPPHHPGGDRWQCLETLLVVLIGEWGCYRHLQGGDQKFGAALRCPRKCPPCPPAQIHPAPNVSSTFVQKPCSRGTNRITSFCRGGREAQKG